MMDIGAVVRLAMLLLVPQLAGLLVMRFVRTASWPVWPAAAISIFGVVFRQGFWIPAREATERAPTHCGMWSIALTFMLAMGLAFHLSAGALFGALTVRRRARLARED